MSDFSSLPKLVSCIAPDEFAAQLVKARVGVDTHHFDAGYFGEVFEVFDGEGLAEAGVMRSACINPRRAGVLEIRTALPHGLGDGQFGHGGYVRSARRAVSDL